MRAPYWYNLFRLLFFDSNGSGKPKMDVKLGRNFPGKLSIEHKIEQILHGVFETNVQFNKCLGKCVCIIKWFIYSTVFENQFKF